MTGSGPSEAESSSEANVIYVEGGQNVDGYGARASTDFCGDSNQLKTTSRQMFLAAILSAPQSMWPRIGWQRVRQAP